MKFLSLKSITKSFTDARRRITVLDNIGFDARKGEFLCIIGPTGCGKTTLLKIIGGLLKADSGGILLNNAEIKNPGRNIAFIFQEFNLLPWRTLKSNIEFGLEIQDFNKREIAKRTNKLIRLVGLSKFEDYYPYQLSSGMKQRVGLARALAVNPDILLADEPFASLDALTREILQIKLLKIITKTKKTVVFITHNIDEAIFLGDRIIVLSKNPARIESIIKINLPKPRWVYDCKSKLKFSMYRNKIKKLLLKNEKA